jgi:hypothetical protein
MSETGPYDPRPIDTADVVIPDGLAELSEKLAANAHDVWSVGRFREGWRYGPHRDDDAKLHPCLVPYGELPDHEREFDRKMVGETIRSIIALGYEIRPKTQSV